MERDTSKAALGVQSGWRRNLAWHRASRHGAQGIGSLPPFGVSGRAGWFWARPTQVQLIAVTVVRNRTKPLQTAKYVSLPQPQPFEPVSCSNHLNPPRFGLKENPPHYTRKNLDHSHLDQICIVLDRRVLLFPANHIWLKNSLMSCISSHNAVLYAHTDLSIMLMYHSVICTMSS
jgi:hypothetical protein